MKYFFYHISSFLVTFCGNAPPYGDLEKVLWYFLLDHDLFHVCTKFHGNWPKNVEILEGGAPLGPGRPQNSLGLIGLSQTMDNGMCLSLN